MEKHLTNFLSELRYKVLEAGASDATIIDAKIISIEDEIITYCISADSGGGLGVLSDYQRQWFGIYSLEGFSGVGARRLSAMRCGYSILDTGCSILDSEIQTIMIKYPVTSIQHQAGKNKKAIVSN